MGILTNTILRRLLPAIIAILLTSCYQDFTPDIDTRPVLCLNSLITAGEPIEVEVTHTWFYTDTAGERSHSVKDAHVSIYANGQEVDVNTYLPQEGDRLRIVATSPTYGEAEAEVSVPRAVVPSDLTWEAVITDTWGGYDTDFSAEGMHLSYSCTISLRARLTINDPADEVNYYTFSYSGFPEPVVSPDPNVTISTPSSLYAGQFQYKAEPIFSEHIGAFDAISGSDNYGFAFFTDRQFSGSSYTLNLKFSNIDYDISLSGDKLDLLDELLNCGLRLTLHTTSASYYNLCCFQWNVDNGTIGDLSDMGMSDPVWGYSNVTTGAGIVAARATSTTEINLHDFIRQAIPSSIL